MTNAKTNKNKNNKLFIISIKQDKKCIITLNVI